MHSCDISSNNDGGKLEFQNSDVLHQSRSQGKQGEKREGICHSCPHWTYDILSTSEMY